jgi:hypothetical protein
MERLQPARPLLGAGRQHAAKVTASARDRLHAEIRLADSRRERGPVNRNDAG